MSVPIPDVILAILLRDRPRPTWERIKRTGTATIVTGGWSCCWSSADGLTVATQLVTDAEVDAVLACSSCGGGPVEALGCRECGVASLNPMKGGR